MDKKMKTTIMGYIGIMGNTLGLHWVMKNENGNYYIIGTAKCSLPWRWHWKCRILRKLSACDAIKEELIRRTPPPCNSGIIGI